jgi:hypothetical protein
MSTKSRSETAAFINAQLSSEYDGLRWHYGAQQLRQLMDFIYDGTPDTDSEHIASAMGKQVKVKNRSGADLEVDALPDHHPKALHVPRRTDGGFVKAALHAAAAKEGPEIFKQSPSRIGRQKPPAVELNWPADMSYRPIKMTYLGAEKEVVPLSLRFGRAIYRTDQEWLLKATCTKSGAVAEYSLRDCNFHGQELKLDYSIQEAEANRKALAAVAGYAAQLRAYAAGMEQEHNGLAKVNIEAYSVCDALDAILEEAVK